MLANVPYFMRPFRKQVVIVLMDKRLREAMMYAPPSPWLVFIVHSLLYTRQFVLRYLMLPRPEALRVIALSGEKNQFGKYWWNKYLGMPYYVKPSLGQRWEPKAWIRWAMGVPVPGDEGQKFSPDGYKIEDLGPVIGKKGWEGEKMKVTEVGRRRCPVAFG